MITRNGLLCILAVITVVFLSAVTASAGNQALTPKELLGKHLFFDTDLSTPEGQSCAVCHGPQVGFTGPKSLINATIAVYPGAVPTRFGNRKPPASAYAGDSPILYFDSIEGAWVGGMFWDGRATGEVLGDPLAEQAQGPFLNPLEQNNPSADAVVQKVCVAHYAPLFRKVCGADACTDIQKGYDCIGFSIAAYERSTEVNPFNSKYDYYLAGKAALSQQELWGLQLFEGKALCSACHPSQPGPNGEPPVFTDFTYDNLGVPKNPLNPFYLMPPVWNPDGKDFIDYGLGGFLKSAGYPAAVYEPELGKMKVPTLRNVDKRPGKFFIKAYTHNGFFKSLKSIVHFYNTRDVLPECTGSLLIPGTSCWPAPEVPMNVNRDELGDLGLTPEEEDAVVAFLKTLSDGYIP